jgi:hypothetical protein
MCVDNTAISQRRYVTKTAKQTFYLNFSGHLGDKDGMLYKVSCKRDGMDEKE